MNRYPTLYSLSGLLQTANGDCTATRDGKTWHPARPMGFCSLGNRIRCAWAVFTGRADAVTWPDGQ